MRKRLTGMAVMACAAMLYAGPSHADFKLCNQSFDVLNVAVGQPADAGFITRGWWRVAPNQCAMLFNKPLPSRYFYIFATDVFGKEALSGATPMCIAPRRFTIDRTEDCLLRGYIPARFVEIDTGMQGEWTVFISPRPGS